MAPSGIGDSDDLGRLEISVLTSFPISVVIGTLLGFLSGLGIGGGSLLVLWLTVVLQFDPQSARGINLLFFIPSAVIACLIRLRRKELEIKDCIPAMVSGCFTAAGTSLLAVNMDVEFLKKLFAFLLLSAGLREVLYRERKAR